MFFPSKTEKIQEILKCMQSFEYFCRYIKVNDPSKGIVNFDLQDYHRISFDSFEEKDKTILIKFRQGRFSTFTLIYALWKCLFYDNSNFTIISKTDREALYMSVILKTIKDNFPEHLKCFMISDNHHYWRFINGSIKFASEKGLFGISGNIILDEAAFFEDLEKLYKTAIFANLKDSKLIIVSSVNGKKNYFYNLCQDKDFHILKFDYRDNPEYNNEDFANRIKINLGEKGFKQEMLCEFI